MQCHLNDSEGNIIVIISYILYRSTPGISLLTMIGNTVLSTASQERRLHNKLECACVCVCVAGRGGVTLFVTPSARRAGGSCLGRHSKQVNVKPELNFSTFGLEGWS